MCLCVAATLGKGKFMGKGKGISFQTACQDVCKPKCRLVPKAVCADVQVPYQVSPSRPAAPCSSSSSVQWPRAVGVSGASCDVVKLPWCSWVCNMATFCDCPWLMLEP